MSYKISFQERIKLGMEELSKQPPVTLEMAREHARMLKAKKRFKEEETERLKIFITSENLWIENLDFSKYVVAALNSEYI